MAPEGVSLSVALLAAFMVLGGIASQAPQAADRPMLTGSPEQDGDVLLEGRLRGVGHSVMQFHSRADGPLAFTLNVDQMRMERDHRSGQGIIFLTVFLVTDDEITPLAVDQYHLGDQDIVGVHLDGRRAGVPERPFWTPGGMSTRIDYEFPAGESVLVVAGWGADGAVSLEVRGGQGAVTGPRFDEPAVSLRHSDVATNGVFVEGGLKAFSAYQGSAELSVTDGDVLIWVPDGYGDMLRETTGGMTCVIGPEPCALMQRALEDSAVRLGTQGSATLDAPDWILAVVVPTMAEHLPLFE